MRSGLITSHVFSTVILTVEREERMREEEDGGWLMNRASFRG